jgi:hypothetical protein
MALASWPPDTSGGALACVPRDGPLAVDSTQSLVATSSSLLIKSEALICSNAGLTLASKPSSVSWMPPGFTSVSSPLLAPDEESRRMRKRRRKLAFSPSDPDDPMLPERDVELTAEPSLTEPSRRRKDLFRFSS